MNKKIICAALILGIGTTGLLGLSRTSNTKDPDGELGKVVNTKITTVANSNITPFGRPGTVDPDGELG